METFTFFADSDLHFGRSTPKANDAADLFIRGDKSDNVKFVKASDCDFVLACGDLTNTGSDGFTLFGHAINDKQEQVQALKKKYVKPIEATKPVYLCLGNHDNEPTLHKPVANYIASRHGSLRYNFMHKGVQFICLNIYPDPLGLFYFMLVAKKDTPIVLFFHYNLIGPFSDWWTDDQKDKFKKTIEGYDVKLIITGHHHVCKEYDWHGYKTIVCGGDGLYSCTFNKHSRDIECKNIK
jgi:predicted MPP superfamily phosphohydrolase